MATPITIEQGEAAAENAEYVDLFVESSNYEEVTPDGTPKRTISGMGMDTDALIATTESALNTYITASSNAADAAALSAQEASVTYNDTLTVQNTTEGFRDEAETFKDSAEQSATDSEESAVRSELYSNLSYKASNYRGDWVDATGQGLLSEVYSHSGSDWQLKEDVADITLSEPSSSNTSWRLLLGELQQVALSVGTTYDNVMYSTDTVTAIVGYIYDANEQVTYSVPVGAQGKFIQSVVNGVLTTSDASVYFLYLTKSSDITFETASVDSMKLLNRPVGSKVKTQEFTDGSGKGGAEYVVVLTSSVTPNEATVITSTINPDISFKYSLNTIFLESLGFGGDIAVNNLALNSALLLCRERKFSSVACGEVVFPGGDYTLSGYYQIPPYMRLKVMGNTILRHSGGGSFFHISYDSSSDTEANPNGMGQNPFNVGNIISGDGGSLALKGDKSVGSVGIEIGLRTGNASSRAHTAWGNISNIVIDGFEVSHYYNNVNTFLIRWYNCMFTSCTDIIKTAVAPNTNSGEQINYVSCGFHNSTRIAWLRTQMNLEFHGCSLDYMQGDEGVRIDADYQRISFVGGWFEAYSATQNGRLITANTGADAHRLHVNIDGVYIQPRDKKQTKLITGACTVNFNNNTIVLNRFENFPESASGWNHYMFGPEVVISSIGGNKWFDQMTAIHRNAGNRNTEFSENALGTTSTISLPTELTGWSISTTYGQSNVMAAQVNESPNLNDWCAQIDSATGTFCDITSTKIPVRQGLNVYQSLAIYSPNDASLNVTMRINFYDESGFFLSTSETSANYSDYPADTFITNKASNSANVPPSAFSCEFQFIIGGYDEDVYIYGAGGSVI